MSNNSMSNEVESYPSPRTAWTLVVLLTVAYIFSFVDRQIINLMIDPIKSDLSLSDTQISLLIGFAFSLFYIIMGVPLGRAADKYNRRNIIVIGMSFWCLMTIACGMARNFTQLFMARLGVGVGEAALSPAALSMITDSFPKDKRIKPIGFYNSAIYLGSGLAMLAGGAIIQMIEGMPPVVLPIIGAMAPWQMVFVIVGIPGIFVAMAIALVQEPVRKEMMKVQASEAAAELSFKDVLTFLLKDKLVYGCIFGAMAMLSVITFMYLAWIPSYFVRAHEWPITDISYGYGLVQISCGPLGIFVGARIGSALVQDGDPGGQVKAGFIGMCVLALSATIVPLIPNPKLAILALGLVPFSLAFVTVNIVSALLQVTPNQMRGQTYALFLMTMSVFGLALGPTAVALVTDFVFGNEAMVGYSLSLIASLSGFIGVVAIKFAIQAFRNKLAETT
ncbi:MAG: MFS family permease [Parvicella sp.]|jgi:MFS family permease